MKNTIKYDKESYTKHLQQIKEKKVELTKVMEQLSDADRRVEAGWLLSSETRDLTQQALKIQHEIAELENKDIEIIDANEETSVVSIGHTYRLKLSNPHGEPLVALFKLVSENPTIRLESGAVSDISINSPIGKSIFGKEIGGAYEYATINGICTATVLEEVKTSQSTDIAEM